LRSSYGLRPGPNTKRISKPGQDVISTTPSAANPSPNESAEQTILTKLTNSLPSSRATG
jgi:hypothetical protein